MFFSVILLKVASSIVFRKPIPDSIPLTGMDRLVTRDYFSLHLGKRDFLALEKSSGGLTGFWWNDRFEAGRPASLPIKVAATMPQIYTQYYKEAELEFNGSLAFLIGVASFKAQRNVFLSRLRQRRFNRKELARDHRIKLLNFMYEETVRQRDFQTSALDYLVSKYGPMIINHPDRDELVSHHTLILESLVSSGDLRKQQNRFLLNPAALSTLARSEQEDRRHQDSVRESRRLVVVTWLLVGVGVLSALSTYFGG